VPFAFAHSVLDLTTGNVHHQFRQLVEIAGSLGHTSLSGYAHPGAMAVDFKLRHYQDSPLLALGAIQVYTESSYIWATQ
jgi:polysaccharide deacetylase 2 family uncharacterized protein YibQ